MSPVGILYIHAAPVAVERFTSSVASSGNSSLRETSMGPFTEAITVYPRAVWVAEPSGLRSVLISVPAMLPRLDGS